MKPVKQDEERQFDLASQYWDRGDTRRAFILFRRLAQRGDAGAQLNVGYCFDQGIAVRRNITKAMYWYRRAHANGQLGAATNIGTVFRDRDQVRRAILWFERALKAGDDFAALEIAKIYLKSDAQRERAYKYLKIVSESDSVSTGDQEAARTLLQEYATGRVSQPKRPKTAEKNAGRRKNRRSPR
jgi:TPR repeat protein